MKSEYVHDCCYRHKHIPNVASKPGPSNHPIVLLPNGTVRVNLDARNSKGDGPKKPRGFFENGLILHDEVVQCFGIKNV